MGLPNTMAEPILAKVTAIRPANNPSATRAESMAEKINTPYAIASGRDMMVATKPPVRSPFQFLASIFDILIEDRGGKYDREEDRILDSIHSGESLNSKKL